MLRRLTIRDFVLVDRLELEFSAGFGTLTGETGAGKSILIDALAFVLGERADSGFIRAGMERAEVCAEFDLRDTPAALALLKAHDLSAAGEDEHELLLRRVLDNNGRSRAYLNGSPVPVTQLREIAEHLLDIHGQHAHQSLLRGQAQRNLLDAHAKLQPLCADVASAWQAVRVAKARCLEASQGAEALDKARQALEWEIEELSALACVGGEWTTLNNEHKRLAHASNLAEGASFALGLLSEGENACAPGIDRVASRIDELSTYDAALSEIAALLQSTQENLGEALSKLRRYADRLELDPQALSDTEKRIEAILTCARKFRISPEDLPSLLPSAELRLKELGESADSAALEARLQSAQKTYASLAKRLSKERAKAASTLGAEISRVMQQLALGGGRLEIALIPLVEGMKEGVKEGTADLAQGNIQGSAHGLEHVEFRIGGLAGDAMRSLAKVASGGELSRISLAIQVVTSQASSIPSLIFDEVDVGIGGGIAEVVGRLLHELGTQRQVLCVTHLAQVAARANWQWQVSKGKENGVMHSRVIALDAAGRIEEIARMLGGVEITPITRQHAKEMLGFA